MKKTILILILTAITLSSCAVFGIGKNKDYYKTLNRWTQAKKVYKDIESRLFIYAVFKSGDFRIAYVDEYSRRYQLDSSLKTILLEREAALSEEYNEFFISAYTPVEEWNDFDKKDSIWKLYLTDKSGIRVEPFEIKKIDSKDPLYREFFPFFDAWSFAYIVKFPKFDSAGNGPIGGSESEFLKLTAAGIMGAAEMTWKLSKD